MKGGPGNRLLISIEGSYRQLAKGIRNDENPFSSSSHAPLALLSTIRLHRTQCAQKTGPSTVSIAYTDHKSL